MWHRGKSQPNMLIQPRTDTPHIHLTHSKSLAAENEPLRCPKPNLLLHVHHITRECCRRWSIHKKTRERCLFKKAAEHGELFRCMANEPQEISAARFSITNTAVKSCKNTSTTFVCAANTSLSQIAELLVSFSYGVCRLVVFAASRQCGFLCFLWMNVVFYNTTNLHVAWSLHAI